VTTYGFRFSRCHESHTGAGKWSVDKVVSELTHTWLHPMNFAGQNMATTQTNRRSAP